MQIYAKEMKQAKPIPLLYSEKITRLKKGMHIVQVGKEETNGENSGYNVLKSHPPNGGCDRLSRKAGCGGCLSPPSCCCRMVSRVCSSLIEAWRRQRKKWYKSNHLFETLGVHDSGCQFSLGPPAALSHGFFTFLPPFASGCCSCSTSAVPAPVPCLVVW